MASIEAVKQEAPKRGGSPILGRNEGDMRLFLLKRTEELRGQLDLNRAGVVAGRALADHGLEAQATFAEVMLAGYEGRRDVVAEGFAQLEQLQTEHPEDFAQALARDMSFGVPALGLLDAMRATRRVVASGGTVQVPSYRGRRAR